MLLLRKIHHITRSYSTAAITTTTTKSVSWRTQLKQNQLVSQISSILLQRHNWASLLQKNFNFSLLKLTPQLFLQILHKTQTNPHISLCFFNWAIKNLGFRPDLKCQCHIIRLSQRSGLSQQVRPILDSLMETHQASVIAESMIRACNGGNSPSDTLSLILESYSNKGLFMEALVVHRKMRFYLYTPSMQACNALLDTLNQNYEIKLACCLHCSMFRTGIPVNRSTWSLVAQILCKDGKFEGIVRLIDLGIYNSVSFGLVIDYYCKIGNFVAALDRLDEMLDKKLDPGFSIYGSILDSACKYGNNEVIERIKSVMVDKGLLPEKPLSEYDLVIQKLCDLGKGHAAMLLFKRACDEKIGLKDATYRCLLRTLCKEGSLQDAIRIYRVVLERRIVLEDSCYYAFANVLCEDEEPGEGFELLKDIIGRGFGPCTTELSKFISLQCRRRRWREVEELLNVMLEERLLPDCLCCCSLIKYYCSRRRIDHAIILHTKVEAMNGALDTTTYNAFLDGLLEHKRVEEAVKIFDYMRGLNLVTTVSFSIMIRGLCRLKEMRKAMKMHDDMLQMGLKPDQKAYKCLISGFK